MVTVIRAITLCINRLQKVPQWIRLTTQAAIQRQVPAFSATSMDLCDNPHIQIMLGDKPQFHSRLKHDKAATVVGWGRKWSGRRACSVAARDGKKCLLIEDGFLRSVGRNDLPLSVICDSQGVYYDAAQPSDLEEFVQAPLTQQEETRAHDLMDLWRKHGVSKYNDSPSFTGDLPDNFVLVIDQVAGDHSITCGGATAGDFDKMLAAALCEHPSSTIVLKVHPDQVNHAKLGHFDIKNLAQNPRIQVISDACHPVSLIAKARAVYTVTSQIGFEALIWGKPVRCFGMPFYAGWGLTQDEQQIDRRGTASLVQLVSAALITYPCYLDPETRRPCTVEVVLRHIGLQRRMMAELPDRILAVGFSPWKQSILRQFLPGKRVCFAKRASIIPNDAAIAFWGGASVPDDLSAKPIIRIEDGFLRSSGLGADLIRPLSWAFDDLGIYFDPRHPSRLERILQDKDLDQDTTDRAQNLITLIQASGLSKYNIGTKNWHPPDTDRRIILVPGQVETDASIRAGCPEIKTNIGLLQAVRTTNPDAFIVYKPHPDVVAGLRRSGTSETNAQRFCNLVVTDADAATMLDRVDEVHTLTSLMGFEALLRGVPVTCYGQPFYAGWGLTQDRVPIPKRTARLSIQELVAGALIEYPRYVSRVSGRLTTPERAIAELADWRQQSTSRPSPPRRMLRTALRLWAQSRLKRSV